MINKIKEVSELLKDKNIDIEVDGSIDDKTAVLCQAAGANIFVSGGYIFNNNNIEQQIVKLQLSFKDKNKIQRKKPCRKIREAIENAQDVSLFSDESFSMEKDTRNPHNKTVSILEIKDSKYTLYKKYKPED